MKKKVLSLLLAFGMLLSLAACAKKEPTAEELLAGARNVNTDECQSMDVHAGVAAAADGEDVSLTLDAGVEVQSDIIHISNMKMEIGTMGITMMVTAVGWLDAENKVSYMNMTAFGETSGWVKSEMDNGDDGFSVDSLLAKFSDADIIKNVAMAEHAKGEDYVVTWELDGKAFADVMNDTGDENLNLDLDDATANCSATFDEETQRMKTLDVICDVSKDEGDGTVEFSVVFNKPDVDKTLVIPSEVLDEAVESEDGADIFSFGDGTEVEPVLPEYSTEGQPDETFGGYDDDAGYNYGGDGGSVTNDNAGYDDVIDPLAEQVAATDVNHKGIYVYHYDGMASMSYSTGGLDWVGDVMVEHMDPEAWGSAENAFLDQVDWLHTWYGNEPIAGSVEDKSVTFAKLDDGQYEIDLAAWNGDMYISADIYTYGGMSAADAVGHLNEMLAMAGVS